MQFAYGDRMPLRILDEVQFWKLQEAEHTVVIRQMVPQLERTFVEALERWENALSQTHAQVERYIESLVRLGHRVSKELQEQIINLTSFSFQQSQSFISLLNQIEAGSTALKSIPVANVVLHHIRRESEYFLGVAQAILADG
ncbi:DUF2935 domain-containing protein [Tumebacillus lipolyticus]|uniref:DUF2935 domain-containing protein n=1 Tax=Tumebacillus lipolyticus TaxID=1280370 RepID=A0ABW4ZSV3_9BACL